MRQEFTNAEYGSITDFVSAVELPMANKDNQDIYDSFMGRGHGAYWYGAGCDSGRAVAQLMRDGWAEGRDRLGDLRDKLDSVELTPQDRRRKRIRTDMGDELDIHMVYAGRSDIAWTTTRRMTTRGPQRIDICANMICSGAEHSDVLFWRGAAAAVLADMLETAGYMVRLVVNFGGKAESAKCSCRIVVKDHGMPFDITSTSAVILPGFFRALGHAWIANHAPHKRRYGGISVGQGIVDQGEILLSHKVRDHGTALAFINDTIKRINDGTLETPAREAAA